MLSTQLEFSSTIIFSFQDQLLLIFDSNFKLNWNPQKDLYFINYFINTMLK